ncbi:MAG: hypothetical protein HYU28_10305 [Actinobacteria bacterium]|nr:hypothetical protein [Actinomycetota bacterium]
MRRRDDEDEASDVTSQGTIPEGVFWVGVALLAAFAVFTWYLVSQVSADDQQWTRLVFVYGAVESIALVAAGAVFGTTVQRTRVREAEEREREAKTAMRQQQTEATIGRSVEAWARTRGAGGAARRGGLSTEKIGAMPAAAGQGEQGIEAELLAFIHELREQQAGSADGDSDNAQ